MSLSEDASFPSWLHSTTADFLRLSDENKIATLDHLIGLCGAKELLHLNAFLPTLLYRDFFRLLPEELALKIILMLDEQSTLNCCLVSKHWNSLLHRYPEIWKQLACTAGANFASNTFDTVSFYKCAYLKIAHLLDQMEDMSAFDILILDGHYSRVMAVTSRNDVIVTGSDDHTVKIWSTQNGKCLRVISVEQCVSVLHLDGKNVFAGSYGGTVTCWNQVDCDIVCSYIGHTSAVVSLHSNSDLDLLITGSVDGSTKLWKLSNGDLLNNLFIQHDVVTSVQILTANSELNPDLENSTIQYVTASRSCCRFMTLENLNISHRVDVSSQELCKYVPFDAEGLNMYSWDETAHVFYTRSSTLADERTTPIVLPKTLPHRQDVLGFGRKFAVFMVDKVVSKIVIVDIQTCKVVCSIPVPNFMKSKYGATVTLGNLDWLNGFTDSNRHGLILATSLIDNTVLALKWRERDKFLQT